MTQLAIQLAIAVLGTVGFLAFVMLLSKQRRWSWLFLFFSLCVLGATAGWLTGNSRDPAIGSVIPAVLTFVAGLTTYLAFARAADPGTPLLLACCTISIALPFFVGELSGSQNRALLDDPDTQYERQVAEEHNRFRLEILKMHDELRLKKLSNSSQTPASQ